MKFLTMRDLLTSIDSDNLQEIISAEQYILDYMEAEVLDQIGSFLRGRYDISYELRPVQDFTYNRVYNDYDRIRISYNGTNTAFGNYWGINLIDFKQPNVEVTEPNYELILVKKPNTCASQWVTTPTPTYYVDVELSTRNQNPNYNPSCGLIIGSNGAYGTNSIINYYNSIYSTSGTPHVDTIDFSTLTVNQISVIIGNIKNFDQYLYKNIFRDFSNDDRSPMLVRCAIDLLKWNLFQRVAPRAMNDVVQTRYDLAIEWLKQVQHGDLAFDFKTFPTAEAYQQYLPFRFGYSKYAAKNKW